MKNRIVFLAIALIAVLGAIAPTPTSAARHMLGHVTRSDALDTVFTAQTFLVGTGANNVESVAIWSPDADIRVRFVRHSGGNVERSNILFPADGDRQTIDLAGVDSVYVFKPNGIARVGVFFLGN